MISLWLRTYAPDERAVDSSGPHTLTTRDTSARVHGRLDQQLDLVSSHALAHAHSEARDAIADHDNSYHEQKEAHDRHIVIHQPLSQPLERALHSRRRHEVSDNRYRDG